MNENNPLTETVFYIMLSLFLPMHGYGIMQNVKVLSSGRVNLGPGTLYGAINTLLAKNWIEALEAAEDSRKKEYKITDLGISMVVSEIDRLEELIENGRKILEVKINETHS